MDPREGRGQQDQFRPGDPFGQYRILRLLGRGGMGEVYEAEHTTLGRSYALKMLPTEFASRPDALERFRREARVMANLEHPNILRVDEFGQTDGRYWLRMERVAGFSIADFGLQLEERERREAAKGRKGTQKDAKDREDRSDRIVSLQDLADALGGRIPQQQLLPILLQICDGLEYAHQHGAIHRDLKPSNILLAPPRLPPPVTGPSTPVSVHVLISDFGLVRLVGEEWVRSQAQVSVQRSMSLGACQTEAAGDEGTSTRSLLGTYEYMSPEQKRGEEVDQRTDIYSLGLMTHRLLTGRGLGVKLPSQIDNRLSRVWDELVGEALEEKASDRSGSCAVIRLRLESIRSGWAKQEEDGIDTESNRDHPVEEVQETATVSYHKADILATTVQKSALIDLGIGVKLEMVWIPAGTFTMGSPASEVGRDNNETQHQVTLTQGFWMGKYEVTQGQWERVIGSNPSQFKNGGADAPVETVSWKDCQGFVTKLNARGLGLRFRLPTEAEWEYACRAGTRTALNNGKALTSMAGSCPNLGEVAWYDQNSGNTTHRVRQKKPNVWGLYDMHGNVWEWCEDWYGDYPTESIRNPTGPSSGSYRVLRGGSWFNVAQFCRAAYRGCNYPASRHGYIGFRVVGVR